MNSKLNSEFRNPKPERSPNSESRRRELLTGRNIRPSGFGFLSDFGLRISDFSFKRPGQRGVALVVTLILLVVITTLAVAFLALSTRETSSVSGSTSTIGAELATDVALERSKAQILAQIASRNSNGLPNDILGPELMVSVPIETNRLASNRMITNPSPPVFIWTNKALNLSSAVDDRFWVDLNRNLQFEQTGYLTDLNDAGMPILGAGGGGGPTPGASPVIQWRVGDPQWIGLLRDPTRPHGADNPFIARYAYLILPAGRSLDINWIHNQAIQAQNQFDGYFRNQGLGPWEMNMAAFLADVNPNYWNSNIRPPDGVFVSPYTYRDFTNNSPTVVRGDGVAFSDARELLCYRFPGLEIGNRRSFGSCRTYFASSALMQVFFPSSDRIDLYCNGPIARFGSSFVTATNADDELSDAPWPGSRSTANYFTIHDLWKAQALGSRGVQANDTPPGFFTRLKAASDRRNSEDRYTYYRILSQLGTDSAPDRDDRLNINYQNVTTNQVQVKGAVTNFVPWSANTFFHAAADRMLTNEFFPYGITNIGFNPSEGRFGIPVTVNGSAFLNGKPLYSPRIHQLLQMTVNIYEATRTNAAPATWGIDWPLRPTVMRPVFGWAPGQSSALLITGYVEETTNDLKTALLSGGRIKWNLLDSPPQSLSTDDGFYDIPILFGARKGIPSFNEFTIQTHAQLTRKLEVRRNASSGVLESTNRFLTMSLSNYFRCEFVNPYSQFPNVSNAYPRPLEMYVGITSTNYITNHFGVLASNGGNARSPVAPTIFGAFVPRYTWTNGYVVGPLFTNAPMPLSAFYARQTPNFQPISSASQFELVTTPLTNRWGLVASNRVLCLLFDDIYLVDCFSSARMNTGLDINRQLDAQQGTTRDYLEKQWSTLPSTVARTENLSEGEAYQIAVSRGDHGTDFSGWRNHGLLDASGFPTVPAAITGFRDFLLTNDPARPAAQAPFSPSLRFVQLTSWEANDPLVHYTVYDLYDLDGPNAGNIDERRLEATEVYHPTNYTASVGSMGKINRRYQPWGGQQPASATVEQFDPAEKDPGVFSPDDWDFPTQVFPNLGWLGRVHRGTPWQTIYFKAADPNYNYNNDEGWKAHTGAAYAPATFPTNDWRLVDIFTAAIHPNATRGRLSINQTNPAAWSAVFGAVPVTTLLDNGAGEYFPFETNIQPATTDVPLQRIVEGINRTRVRQFTHLSDFLAVPELTISSPFLQDDATRRSWLYRAVDSDYERLPQQILSLVKVGEPRYVVYAWGQSLKPADYVPGIGIGIDAGTKLTRNYQITGEMATRSVVRVEFERLPNGQSLFNRPHAVVESFNILPNE